jgi:membrane protease YdiL (CAAX protease family)
VGNVSQRPAAGFIGRVEVLLETAGTGLACTGLFALAAAIPGGLTPLLGLPAGLGPVDTPAYALTVLLAAWTVPLLIRRLLGGWRRRHLVGRLGARPGRGIFHGLVAAAALNLWSRLLLLWDPRLFDATWQTLGIESLGDALRAALFVAPLATALPEELVFRGYLQGALSTRFGAGWALVLTALVFALFHAYQGPVAVVLTVVPAALVLGVLYRSTGSLVAPLVAHAGLNAASFIQLGVETSRPELALPVVGGLALVSAGLLLAGRRQVRAGLGLTWDLLRQAARPRRIVVSLLAVGCAALVLGLAGGLLATAVREPSHAAPATLPTALLLWTAAATLHRLRGLDLFRDAARADAADPGAPAGVDATGAREW